MDYLNQFKGKVFVLKIGGEVITSKEILKNILADIKELFDAGIKVMLIHGGGVQADEVSKKMGHTPKKVNGRRITQQEDIEVVKMMFGGSLNLEILSVMKSLNLKGIRISGLDGNLLEVSQRPVKDDVDYGFVGDIISINTQIIEDVLGAGCVPIISPIAATADGTILNINADTIATEVAISLQAEKLIIFTNTDGVYKNGEKISSLTTQESQQLIDEGTATDGMAVKLTNCIKAAENGAKRVHIINGLSAHSLLREVLTTEGVGTMIVSMAERDKYLTEMK